MVTASFARLASQSFLVSNTEVTSPLGGALQQDLRTSVACRSLGSGRIFSVLKEHIERDAHFLRIVGIEDISSTELFEDTGYPYGFVEIERNSKISRVDFNGLVCRGKLQPGATFTICNRAYFLDESDKQDGSILPTDEFIVVRIQSYPVPSESAPPAKVGPSFQLAPEQEARMKRVIAENLTQ